MEIDTILNANAESNQVFSIALASLNESNPPKKYLNYFSALEKALQNEPPPFDTESYSDEFKMASENGKWLATSLITNAQREGDGATRLWSLAASTDDDNQKELLKEHAIDESGHSLAYLCLLDIVFPNAVDETFREELKTLSPHYSQAQEPHPVEGSPYARVPSIDDYIQMNIAEIRTTIHHIMQRRALENFCPNESKERMKLVLDSLMKDEMKHVSYTAKLIDKMADNYGNDKMEALYQKRLKDFNDITKEELNQKIFD